MARYGHHQYDLLFTVSAASEDVDIHGIHVYFADANGNLVGTQQAASGDHFPYIIPAGASGEGIEDITVNLKFSSEADCMAAIQLCVTIIGVSVGPTDAESCLNLGTNGGEAGGKDCTDQPNTAAPDDPTGPTGTTDAGGTSKENQPNTAAPDDPTGPTGTTDAGGTSKENITIDGYALTGPSDPADITYNRVTDTTIEFTVTVSASTVEGYVDLIEVHFANSNGDKIGTQQTANRDHFPYAIPAGVIGEGIEDNTVNLKFASEADCTAATQLCVTIIGSGVDPADAEFCLNLGTNSGEAGGKDCTDPPNTAAPDNPTGPTGTTDAGGTSKENIKIDSYEITNPADPASDVTYNRATDTSLVFKVTVSSAAEGGNVEGIDVYFARADNSVIGTAKAAGGDAPTADDPAAIPSGGGAPVPLVGNTVDLKFDSEADCTAAAKVCVKIKGDVDTNNDNDFDCLNIGTENDEVGDKDCADPPTTAAPDDPTGLIGTTDADGTTKENPPTTAAPDDPPTTAAPGDPPTTAAPGVPPTTEAPDDPTGQTGATVTDADGTTKEGRHIRELREDKPWQVQPRPGPLLHQRWSLLGHTADKDGVMVDVLTGYDQHLFIKKGL
ncbi:uncharacterized protein [Ptychodera flava]|uniref:uncharacterized protein n=1 Tax=Ptychodera flava TaxID=63121 RepID=UPI00396A913C